MRRLFNLIALALVSLALVACSTATTAATNGNDTTAAGNGTLKVGMECAYAPFNWTESEATDSNVPIANVSGAYADGYDVQVAKRIASSLDMNLEVYAIEWDGLIPALTSGTIDLIIAGMSPTDERKETIDFTDGYYKSTHVLLVQANSQYASATTLDGFAGANVIGQTGTLYADLVPQMVAKGAVAGTDLDTVPEIVNAIINGVVDVTILEEPVAKGIVSQYASTSTPFTYVTPTDGFTVDECDVTVSIGCRKGYSLESQINNVLNTVLTEAVRTQLMTEAVANAPSAE